MRRLLLASLFTLLFSTDVEAQSSSVTLQVTDVGAQTWNNGTWSVLLVSQPGATTYGPPFNLTTGGSVPSQSQSGALSATGGALMTLSQNSFITPTQSKWQFNVCPASGIPFQCFTQAVTIAGASQTVTLTPPAIVVTCGPGVSAYADTEVSCGVGGQYYNVTSVGSRQCTAVTGNTCTTWASAGGVSPNSPVPAASAQGPRFNVKNYGAIGDAQHITDGVTAGSSGHTVTSATAAFVAGDVGKKIVCAASGNGTPLMPISTITARNSATQVTVSGAGDNGAASGLRCIWYIADDTTAWQSATTAAGPAIASLDPNVGKTLGAPPGTVYCPEGGYAVSGRIFSFVGVGSSIGPSLIGDPGKNHCIIYLIPGIADPGDGFPVLINFYNGIGFDMENISIDGLGFSSSFTHPLVGITSSQQFTLKKVKITNTSVTGANNGTLDFNASSNGSLEDIFIQGAGNTANDFAVSFHAGTSEILVRRSFFSNHNQNLLVDGNSGTPRGVFGDNGITFIGVGVDECDGGTLNCAVISNGGLLNAHDGVFMQGSSAANYALSVDGTSRAYLSNVSCGVYGSISTTSNCMTIASGGEVYATMSDLRGNGASGVAVNGPAGAKFTSLGGNKIRNSNNGVITDITAATYATQGFTGGIVPKSSETHTPNTCMLAITPIVNATTYTLCNNFMDQNYQILKITASSQNTTTCATAPIVTISDGTQSATLTLTSGAASWASAALSAVFATGNTMTVKYDVGALSACATPPTNLAVSFILQSVLNP